MSSLHERSLSEMIDKVEADQALERQRNIQAAKDAARLEEQREQEKIGELFVVLDFCGTKELLEELRDTVWGGVGIIETYSWSRQDIIIYGPHGPLGRAVKNGKPSYEPATAGYTLSLDYLDAQESFEYHPSGSSSLFRILSTSSGGGHYSRAHNKLVKHKHKISVTANEDNTTIQINAQKVVPSSTELLPSDDKSAKKVFTPSDGQIGSRSTLRQILAELCLDMEWVKANSRHLSIHYNAARYRSRLFTDNNI